MKNFYFRFYCLTAGFILFFAVESFGQRQIGTIETVGNRSISRLKILSKVRSRVGAEFDAAVADEDAKRIAQLPGVEYSYYNVEPVDGKIKLAFVVVERDLVRSINFVGNSKYKNKKLRKTAGIKIGDYLDPVRAEAAADTLAEFYKKKGYAFVDVTVDKERIKTGRLLYKIDEGSRVKINSVTFDGNKNLKTRALKRVIKVKKRKFYVLTRYFQKRVMLGEVNRLKDVYYDRGYLDVGINQKLAFNESKNKVNIIYEINEGPAYAVEAIIINGLEQFAKEPILAEFKLKQGQTFNQRKANSDTESLLKRYRQTGFVDAKVDKKITFISKDKVNVEVDITAGQQFRVGKIDIIGNEQTQDRVIRRILDEYDFSPGQWYNADIARGDGTGELEKEVRYRAVAESATITDVGDTPGQKDARISIVEGQTGSIMLGAGVASDSGVIGQLIFEQRNFDIKDKPESFMDLITGNAFKGAGQHLRIALEPGTELSRYSVSFTEPYLRNKPISLDVVGSSWQRFRESHDEERLKGYVGFERRFKNKWRKSIGFRVEDIELTSLDTDAPKEIIDDKDDNAIVGVKLGVSRIMIDDRFYPTKGYTFRAGYEQVAGDHTFGILSGTYKRYRTIYEDLAERKTVLSTRLHAAAIVGNAPVFEKFYAGGSQSIRGFDYRGVSPRGLPTVGGVPVAGGERKDPIGSDWLFLANTEVIVPLVSDNFAMLFFVDGGAVDSGNFRASIGTGIQILIPRWFGPVPMRFELAAPFMKDSEDETEVFSFSVGRLF